MILVEDQEMRFVPGREWDFPDSDQPVVLTYAELDEFGPCTFAEFCAGYYRNFNGTFDGAIYSEDAKIARDRFASDPARQRFLIASYFKWRDISWKGIR